MLVSEKSAGTPGGSPVMDRAPGEAGPVPLFVKVRLCELAGPPRSNGSKKSVPADWLNSDVGDSGAAPVPVNGTNSTPARELSKTSSVALRTPAAEGVNCIPT